MHNYIPMKLTPTIQKAIITAARLHLGQVRKEANGAPYIIHPYSVAWILADNGAPEETVVAALLHDVLEDVKGYGFNKMQADFGERVTALVQAVSEDKDPNVETDEKENWLERKEKYLAHLASADPEAVRISVADKIHNLQSMTAAYAVEGDSLWARFNAPADKKLWFYGEVLRIARQRLGETALVGVLERELNAMKALVPKV